VKTFDNRPARPARIPERFADYFRTDAETGRKVLVKSLISSTLFACLGVALAHAAKADEVYRKLDAAAAGTVAIENTAGSVLVRGWSKNEVEVSGDLGSDVEELVFDRDGNVVNVHVKTRRGSGRSSDTDLVVRVEIIRHDIHACSPQHFLWGDASPAHGLTGKPDKPMFAVSFPKPVRTGAGEIAKALFALRYFIGSRLKFLL
jgi:hypothetical protein